ncbi:hypothetical protein Ahy_B01g052162 [Arachis hypogaea]|uniref:Uncharacterized protein n=1 Tax=Arachis hypogaea TaxID=3818 RepID=A0A445ANP5_ARAHY|nr:hypothetical protein Ahy_B01g052162 [Arachis hypogaea]
MVSNPKYVPPSTLTTLPPTAQQAASTFTPPPAMDVAALESSHGSEGASDASPPPPIILVRFTPNNNACTQEKTNVIKLMYDHPWHSYMKILAETRKRWFQKWALHFRWDAEHDLTMRKIFDHRMGRRLQQMLDDALFVHWETNEGFWHRCLTNRANRASARSSKYTGSSATFMKTKVRLLKSLDREATLAETFKYTHTLKENKETFADQRSQDHYSQQGGENATDGSTASVVDLDVVWRETTSAQYKNRVYGIGSFFGSSLRTSTLRQSSSSTTSRVVESEEGVDLRL